MEVLKVLDYSNVFIASYFTDDRQCAHPNREHSLIYILSGELEINERGKITHLHQGDCAFIRRDNRVILSKIVKPGTPYRSLVLKFSRQFLREYYHTMDRNTIPPRSKKRPIQSRSPSIPPSRHREPLRISNPLLRLRHKTIRRNPETENGRRTPHTTPYRPQPIRLPLRLLRTVENRHRRIHERKLHVRPLHGRNSRLHRPEPLHIQTRFQEIQRPATPEMDSQTQAPGRTRTHQRRKKENLRSMLRCRLQKPIPFFQSLQTNVRICTHQQPVKQPFTLSAPRHKFPGAFLSPSLFTFLC